MWRLVKLIVFAVVTYVLAQLTHLVLRKLSEFERLQKEEISSRSASPVAKEEPKPAEQQPEEEEIVVESPKVTFDLPEEPISDIDDVSDISEEHVSPIIVLDDVQLQKFDDSFDEVIVEAPLSLFERIVQKYQHLLHKDAEEITPIEEAILYRMTLLKNHCEPHSFLHPLDFELLQRMVRLPTNTLRNYSLVKSIEDLFEGGIEIDEFVMCILQDTFMKTSRDLIDRVPLNVVKIEEPTQHLSPTSLARHVSVTEEQTDVIDDIRSTFNETRSRNREKYNAMLARLDAIDAERDAMVEAYKKQKQKKRNLLKSLKAMSQREEDEMSFDEVVIDDPVDEDNSAGIVTSTILEVDDDLHIVELESPIEPIEPIVEPDVAQLLEDELDIDPHKDLMCPKRRNSVTAIQDLNRPANPEPRFWSVSPEGERDEPVRGRPSSTLAKVKSILDPPATGGGGSDSESDWDDTDLAITREIAKIRRHSLKTIINVGEQPKTRIDKGCDPISAIQTPVDDVDVDKIFEKKAVVEKKSESVSSIDTVAAVEEEDNEKAFFKLSSPNLQPMECMVSPSEVMYDLNETVQVPDSPALSADEGPNINRFERSLSLTEKVIFAIESFEPEFDIDSETDLVGDPTTVEALVAEENEFRPTIVEKSITFDYVNPEVQNKEVVQQEEVEEPVKEEIDSPLSDLSDLSEAEAESPKEIEKVDEEVQVNDLLNEVDVKEEEPKVSEGVQVTPPDNSQHVKEEAVQVEVHSTPKKEISTAKKMLISPERERINELEDVIVTELGHRDYRIDMIEKTLSAIKDDLEKARSPHVSMQSPAADPYTRDLELSPEAAILTREMLTNPIEREEEQKILAELEAVVDNELEELDALIEQEEARKLRDAELEEVLMETITPGRKSFEHTPLKTPGTSPRRHVHRNEVNDAVRKLLDESYGENRSPFTPVHMERIYLPDGGSASKLPTPFMYNTGYSY
ncbi:hypothetical protein PCE1_001960 [Barthelona sp. PCE]